MELNEFVEKFAELFEDTDPAEFTPETYFRELDEWNSFQALSVMALIKSEYDVAISAVEMRSASTIEELFDTVQKHLS